jgi:hopene-associated glycosyltransferase HpnB
MTWLWTGLSAASLAAWAWLLIGRGGFWKAGERLDEADDASGPWPPVTAVVPARDEADVIGPALDALAAQDYPGRLAIVVVDDASTDGTAAASRAALADVAGEVVPGAPLPRGWTGKLWALDQGIRRAAPDSRYLWLTDADIVHAPDTLRRLVGKAETERLDLVSLMVRLRAETGWEKLLVPAFVFFFQKLYPGRAHRRLRARPRGQARWAHLARPRRRFAEHPALRPSRRHLVHGGAHRVPSARLLDRAFDRNGDRHARALRRAAARCCRVARAWR